MPLVPMIIAVWFAFILVALVLGRAAAITDAAYVTPQQGSAGAVKTPVPTAPSLPAALTARPLT
jgi:hypothetical protein